MQKPLSEKFVKQSIIKWLFRNGWGRNLEVGELRDQGVDIRVKNIQVPRKDKQNITKKDGYKLLLRDNKCNLGWRILSSFALSKNDFKEAVRRSFSEQIEFERLLKKSEKNKIIDILRILKNFKRGKKVNEKDCKKLFEELGYNPLEITLKKLKEDIGENITPNKSYKNTAIKITTLLGAKGLTSDYVFLVSLDDKYILGKTGISDEKICQFIVAITRTKKRLYIYSGEDKQPTFVGWLDNNLYDEN